MTTPLLDRPAPAAPAAPAAASPRVIAGRGDRPVMAS